MKGLGGAAIMDPALAMEVAALSQRRVLDEAVEKGNSEIQKYYENATIFVTGGSGFLGKHMIEKLFRSCKIKKIFMLLRSKNGKTLDERLSKIIEDPVYNDLKKRQPEFIQKLIPVNGDVTESRLGLSDEDWLNMTQEVEIIIHGAATIRFDELLKDATIINIRGTKEVLLFGKQCRKLKSFVHVSTAYSHATKARDKTDVLEEFYPVPIPPDTMIQLAETCDEETLQKITPSFLQSWPNTYGFTKAIAEDLVRSMSNELPVCIVRPAIVICCYREPSPGWIDESCAYGPSGLILGLGLGVIHVMYVDFNVHVDLVPADVVNNAIIAAGWETARKYEAGEREAIIYTVTGSRNPMKLGQVAATLQNMRHLISPKAVWYCCSISTKYKFLVLLCTWLFHYIPAFFIDNFMKIIGKKPQFIKLYTKVYTLSSVFSFYLTHEWNFGDKNLKKLYDKMSPTDQEIYNFEISKIDRLEQIFIWYMGLRKYVIKDNLTGTNYAVKKQAVLRIINYIVLALYGFIWWKILTYLFSSITYIL